MHKMFDTTNSGIPLPGSERGLHITSKLTRIKLRATANTKHYPGMFAASVISLFSIVIIKD
jgi:hypothetical protein